MDITKHVLEISLEPISDNTYTLHTEEVILSKEEAALVKEVLLRSSCLSDTDGGAAALYAEIVEWVDKHTETDRWYAGWLAKSVEVG